MKLLHKILYYRFCSNGPVSNMTTIFSATPCINTEKKFLFSLLTSKFAQHQIFYEEIVNNTWTTGDRTRITNGGKILPFLDKPFQFIEQS